MQIQGPLSTYLPQATKRRKRKPDTVSDNPEQLGASKNSLNSATGLQPELEAEYIAAGEAFDFNEGELSVAARRALKGYWAVAQQGRFEWQRIDIYV